ncbi:MAG: 50S ribosomal protein L6 [candidate division Zixibacteria bacterium]|nr:50S ribosomal protein L6 [candidate division Zixibacteria bacterium]
MSRVGKNPVILSGGVKAEVSKHEVTISGPQGKLVKRFHPAMEILLEDNKVLVKRKSDSKLEKSLHGLTRALINNMVKGVSEGFKKTLTIVGVGYKAEPVGNKVSFNLGFSHSILFKPPEGIKITVETPTKIVISGADKELVGQVAAKLRSFRPPEPYKGKGIRYEEEKVRKKAGKAAAG